MKARASITAGDRVLITRLNYLGDVVLSLPLVDAMMRAVPGVEIDYLTRRAGADLLCGDRRLARVIALDQGPRASWRVLRTLRARRYHAVIDLYSNPRSAWLSWLSGAPVRIGGDRRGRRRLYTHPVCVPRSIRAVTDVFLRYADPLGIAPVAGRPVIELTADERVAAGRRLAEAGAPRDAPRVGVHPGGKWPVKRWPAAGFVALIGRLQRELGAAVVLFTGPEERDATDRVLDGVGNAAIRLPAMGVRETAAVIAELDGMVACDGGIMHVSVAVGTPTVGVFGSSEPGVWFPYERWGPYRAAFIDVPCRPCHRHECPLGHTRCLNDLDAGAVMARVREVVPRWAGRAP
jgi:lipopolysaccharide heptosyltransferase II